MKEYYCIFGGGGIRGAAYTGVLKALDELKLNITGYAGSSIGAVIAALVTFGYTHAELQETFDNINFEFFKDINLNFGKDFALSKGNNFYEWMKTKIESKFYSDSKLENKAPVRFKDIDKDLVVFSVDLTTSKLHEFSKAKTPDVEIAHAVRTSVAMPGLYAPVFNENQCLVDGDLLKSMPLWMASDTISSKKERILEFRLEANDSKKKILNTVEYLNAVYDAVSGIASDYVINMYKNHDKYDYIKLNLEGISVIDFMISKEKKHIMAKCGYEATINYFNKVYPIKKERLYNLYKIIFDALQKTIFLLKNNKADSARYALLTLFSEIISDKELLDKDIISSIIKLKNEFNSNYIIKNTLFSKKPTFINYNYILTSTQSLFESISHKMNDFT